MFFSGSVRRFCLEGHQGYVRARANCLARSSNLWSSLLAVPALPVTALLLPAE
jgi:hypothetical protein